MSVETFTEMTMIGAVAAGKLRPFQMPKVEYMRLVFQQEPDTQAAEFIKKTLINAYTLKAA